MGGKIYFALCCMVILHLKVYGGFAKQELETHKISQNETRQDNKQEVMQTYSIVNDLRLAFEPYATLDTRYKDILQDYNKNAKDSMQLPYNYTSFLKLLDTKCCNLPRYAINSFDLKYFEKDLDKLAKAINDDNKTSQKPKQNQTQNNPKRQEKIKQKTKQESIDIKTLAPKCLHKRFHIIKDEKLQINTLLYALAKECDFSIQYTHNAKKALHQNQSMTLNIKNKPLDFILEILLSDMFYTIDSHRLIISDTSMKIFAINYISSARIAQSNTDVLFAQEQQDNSIGYSGGYGGFYGGYSNLYSSMPSLQTPQNMSQYGYNQNISSYLDNLALRNQLLSQMSAANDRFGKSGTKVYSLDEVNFWSDIESKLQIMLDVKLGDKFMIDKGAGLIAVWTTRQKMRDVSRFLQSLEHRMNMQVAIDVEILSLIHYQTNSTGIDWQAIFSILNPTNSNLNLSLGSGGTMLTLGNNNADLQSIFNLLRTYGDLRSLSNPKIMALNNQPALISVGSVLRYTQNLVYQSNNTNTTIQNTSTQYPSVFAGILLDITPSISEDSVILRINPSITKTKDPDTENAPQALSAPPNLSTNQLSSIVKLKDGERVIIGGLLSNVTQNATQAIPKLGETKVLRNLFGKQSVAHRSEELIIIITPHIIR